MKFPQSIRWRLQLWYGVLLVVLLGGFGITAYLLENSRQIRSIDEELQQRLPVLVESQRPVEDDPELREFGLNRENAALFDLQGDGAFYYVVWLLHGESPIYRSSTAPRNVPKPKSGDLPNRSRGELRESFLFPGPGDCVLVGRSIHQQLTGLQQLGWWLAVVGSSILVLGLAGGAWLVTRALRPIRAISSAAEKIASGDLTQRILSQDTESELGQLTGVLNSTFARLDTVFSQQARFTADAAHELRTPLAVMLTHTQNGLASDGLTEEHREAFEASLRAAQRMRRLTESLLTLARIDSGQVGIRQVACELGPLVREATALLSPLAQQQAVSLETELHPSTCVGNSEQLEQVITNLISNAIFYNRPGGKVRISAITAAEQVILTIADTGQGIQPHDLPHIFERFYRADKARSGATARTGLGLAITQSIVLAHCGSIHVSSEFGQGSIFTVRLPVFKELPEIHSLLKT